jgi:hypothetical protein
MNPIEAQWHQLKKQEIAGQMFDKEYDLALAVMDGMKARSGAGEYALGVLYLIAPSYLLLVNL